MAQQYTTDSGVLTVPGAYVKTQVQTTNAGVSTTGVITLVGEADAGPDYSLETDISTNFFGPDEYAAVAAKYKSGSIVDAFRIAANPSQDPQIQGAPSKIFLVKTNASTKAQSSLLRAGTTAYGTLADKSYGALGNNIYFAVAAGQAEAAATTGSFAFIPVVDSTNSSSLKVRVNGGAAVSLTIPRHTTAGVGRRPSDFIGSVVATTAANANLAAMTGVIATGGQTRGALVATGQTLATAASGASVTITYGAAAWVNAPVVGDTILIPNASGDYAASGGSVIKGTSTAGAYVVTAVTINTLTALKVRNVGDISAITNPDASISVQTVSATPANDITAWSPIVMTALGSATDRGIIAGPLVANLTGTSVAGNLVITLSAGSWVANPQAGDYLFIPGSAPTAIANAAGGWWSVVSATNNTVTLSKLSPGALTTFTATAIAAAADLQCYRPQIDGLSKTIEIFDGSGTTALTNQLATTAGASVTFLSTSTTPVVLKSTAEYKATLTVQRSSDGVNETVGPAGGNVALRLGYFGTTATVTISSTGLTTSIAGGSGANLNILFSGITTVGDLVAKINSFTGYTAAAPTALMSQQLVTSLDQGTWSCCSQYAATQVVGIKKDAFDFFAALGSSSLTVQLGATTAARAAAGLPEIQATTFLASGARGPTTAAAVSAAIDACEKIRTNFIVTCFSRDASAAIADGVTDSASTWTIDAVNAALSAHVTKMSKLQRRRPRQGFGAYRGSLANAKLAAATLANARVALAFQDVKVLAADGTIHQFHPWMAGVLAAGMQAAGFYRPIFNKSVNCSGVIQAAGDFVDSDESAIADCLIAGLLVLKARDTGGFAFVSDQTTYTIDSNFVYNSIQAVYVADTLAMTLAQRLERAFVGQSLADVSAALVVSYIKGILSDLRSLKLITASDDAPEGFKDLRVQILGPAIAVNLTVIEATGVYFIPINVLIQQVTQSAAA